MKKKHNIEDETPILPWIIAESVVFESLHVCNNPERAKALYPYLVGKTETIYQNNAQFRASMMRDDGRDKLQAFMRHWAAGFMVKDGVPRSAIPVRWLNGSPLP